MKPEDRQIHIPVSRKKPPRGPGDEKRHHQKRECTEPEEYSGRSTPNHNQCPNEHKTFNDRPKQLGGCPLGDLYRCRPCRKPRWIEIVLKVVGGREQDTSRQRRAALCCKRIRWNRSADRVSRQYAEAECYYEHCDVRSDPTPIQRPIHLPVIPRCHYWNSRQALAQPRQEIRDHPQSRARRIASPNRRKDCDQRQQRSHKNHPAIDPCHRLDCKWMACK